MDTSLCKLQEIVKGREAWCAAGHDVTGSDTTERLKKKVPPPWKGSLIRLGWLVAILIQGLVHQCFMLISLYFTIGLPYFLMEHFRESKH